MAKKPFYITTTLPYVNSDPHIGFAMEIVRADIIARWKKLNGFEVFFNTGTDEHGLKIYQKALHQGENPQQYVDRYVEKFKQLKEVLGLLPDINFVRTTDAHHVKAAQEFWKICDKNGFIYRKNYKTKYCPGCELERTDIEIENGRCFLHQNIDLIIIEEENYFFKFSAFGQKLLDLYAKNPNFVVPSSRLNEIRAFVERGLEDFSISRLKEKMPWGIAVPGDDKHVMYVWFDALVNYVSTVGWPDDEVSGKKVAGSFEKWCRQSGGMVQYCGKDNLRQQSAMWQAMLMAAGLPASQTIVIDGFVTGEGGIKMSKSLGNVIDPKDVVKEYGTEALRYYLAREVHPFEDSPFTMEKFKESFNAALANGLGNLVSRVMKMANTNLDGSVTTAESEVFPAEYVQALDSYNIQAAANVIWKLITEADVIIQEKKPFSLIKTDKKAAQDVISDLCVRLYTIAILLQPIMPETAAMIQKLVKENKSPDQPLFLRK